MKSTTTLVVLTLAVVTSLSAQVPQKFSYQAVAIDANGLELKNTPLCLRATIIKGSINGNQDWIEVHPDASTDEFGLFTIEIGEGDPIGGSQPDFASIDWGAARHFLKVEMSVNNACSNFILVGTNQLLSVPYALYAEKAGRATTATFADSASVSNHAQTSNFANTANVSNTALYADSSSVAYNSYFSNIANSSHHSDTANVAVTAIFALSAGDDLDKDPTNELQELSSNGTTLNLSGTSGGTSVTFDPSSTNEIQSLSVNGNTLSISDGNSVSLNPDDADADPTNEMQSLTVIGNTLTISGGNSVTLNPDDADADPTNEIQTLTANGNTLSLSGTTGGTSVTFDPSSTNEIQSLAVSGNTLSISGGNSVTLNPDDADADPTNEIQTLTLSGNTLAISGGNSVNLNPDDADSDATNELQDLTFDAANSLLGLTGTSTMINLSALPGFNAAGSDLDFPQGVAQAKFIFVPDQYTVPADSVFYLVAAEDQLILPGVGFSFGIALTGPNLPVFKPGTDIDNCRCIGFLKPKDPYVEPITVVLTPNQSNYFQVPFNKNFVIKSGLNQTTPLTLNGFTINPFSSIIKAFVIPEGTQIKNLGNAEIILTGYLYF